MGNVARQGFISSISAYLGVAIGYLNVIVLMPKYMTQEEIGLFRTIIAIAILLVPFAFFGSGPAILKFYPKLRDRIPQLLGFLIVVMLSAFTLVLGLSYLFQDEWFSLFQDKAPEVNQYFLLIYALLFLMTLFSFFQAIAKSNYTIILPSFLRDFFYKAMNAGMILAVGIGLITFHQYLLGHLVAYIVICLILGVYVIRTFAITFSFRGIFERNFYRDILNFISFSILGNFGIILVLQIDQIMVSQMLGLEDNAVYTTALFMAIVIELPRRYVSQIIHPYISQDLHDNNFEKINRNYKDVSNTLLWLGGFLFLGITLNLDNIYAIMPNGELYRYGFWVVYLVGATKLVDVIFSVNGEIIAISRYYKLNVVLIAMLGILTVVTNRIFIPIFGIEGAAIASLLTYLVFNLIKYLILKVNFSLDPFTIKTVYLLLFLTGVYFGVDQLPVVAGPWLDILWRSFVIGVAFILSIYLLRPSEEFIKLISVILSRIKKG